MVKTRSVSRVLFVLVPVVLAASMVFAPETANASVTVRVPQDYPTIQAAVDAVSPGDTIEIASGTYFESIRIEKSITIVGTTYDPADPRNNTTIIDGGRDPVITIGSGVVPGPTVNGIVIRNGKNGIVARSPMTLEHSYLTGSVDSFQAVSGAGGVISNNVFEASRDDAIDINHAIRDFTIEDNEMLGSRGDGIEIRLTDDAISDTADIVIRGNRIVGSATDGVQLIDYFQDTNRVFVIERNLFRGNGKAAIGMLDNGQSGEDFRAASIRERVLVFHNTFVDNDHGVSGGDNLIALNNIFKGHALAMKNVDASSIASYNLFWDNAVDSQGSMIDASTTLFADPLLDGSDRLRPGSPAIDAGTAHFEWLGHVVMDQPPSAYMGAAPDLGWMEHMPGTEPAPLISGFAPASGAPGTTVTIDGSNFTGASDVRFGAAAASFSVASGTRITTVVPAGATTAPIRVIGPGGTGTSATSFIVPAPAPVRVDDYSFKPKSLQIGLGTAVQWLFQGPSPHTSTESMGLGPAGDALFDSGSRGAGEMYEFTFAAAGGYSYRSTLSEPTAMTGTIKVPVSIAPVTGTTATEFTITWASEGMAGFGFAVQSRFRAQGSTTWTSWASFGSVQSQPSGTFTPDRGAGTYQFRSSLRNEATGRASLRSPATAINVTTS